MNKEGWLKVGVVGAPICAYIMLVHLPTTSPYRVLLLPEGGESRYHRLVNYH